MKRTFWLLVLVVTFLAMALWPKPQDPKPACVGDAKLAYTEGFDAAVGLARGMCGQISPSDKAGCMAKLHTLYQQDKPQP